MEGKAEMETPAKEVSASGADASYDLPSYPHSQIMYLMLKPPPPPPPPIRTVRRTRRARAWTCIKMPR
jgi:hypothetical protein